MKVVEQSMDSKEPLLMVRHLKKHFPITNSLGKTIANVKAVNDVSFDLYHQETLGLVGESGCGKSTTGRIILRLIEPTEGKVFYKGHDIFKMKNRQFLSIKKDLQMIFQDPNSSLNPKKRIGISIQDPMKVQGIGNRKERIEKTMELLNKVGLRHDQYYRYPHEFSGGQRQRIGIARALAVQPEIIICDEPVSALDVSIQSQVINLLQDLQEEFGQSYIFIAHDLSVVRHISDRIGVMYLGNIVELSDTEELFKEPLHPYTKVLLSAIPVPNPLRKKEKIVVRGDVPSPMNLPNGCVFHTRCPFVMKKCKTETPKLSNYNDHHKVACHLYH